MFNEVRLMGRIAKDIELKYTQSGVENVSFSIAVERDFKSKDNNEKKTDFIDIVAWRNTAKFINSYFSKGKMILVCGALQIDDWTDKD